MDFWSVSIGDVVGTMLALAGFGLTFREARRARQSADRAVARVTTARRLSDALEISSRLTELDALVAARRTDAASVLCTHIREATMRVHADAIPGTASHANTLWVIARLTAMQGRLRGSLTDFELETTVRAISEARYRLLLVAEAQQSQLGRGER